MGTYRNETADDKARLQKRVAELESVIREVCSLSYVMTNVI